MLHYLIRRLSMLIPTLLGVSLLVFVLMRLIPGDPAVLELGAGATPSAIAQVRAEMHLDDPVPVQYARWIGGVLRGDLGSSHTTGVSVVGEIRHAIPVTFELVLIAVSISILIGVPGGVIAAVYRNSAIDMVARLGSMLGISIPNFWVGQLMILLPSLLWNHAPPFGFRPFFDDPWTNIQQFYLPGIALGIASSSILMRLTRSSMLEVLRSDYIRTAWAKGVSGRAVILRHGLRNALVPIVTVLGLQVAALLGGAVIIEQVFALPGTGRLMLESINRRDYAVVQGVVLLIGTVYVLMNVLVDLSYGWIDPRVVRS